MTINEDSQQHQIKDLASAKENIPTSRETALLLGNERRKTRARMQSNFHCRRHRCCVSSKVALLILVWNLIIVAGFENFLDPNFFRVIFEIDDYNNTTSLSVSYYVFCGGISFPLLPSGWVSSILWLGVWLTYGGEDIKLLSIVFVLSGGA
jgi:hypothetical protein